MNLFTSESVSDGHPDKIADQVSDAVLDAILEQDPTARVACETFVKTGMVMVGGEITTTAQVDIEQIVRDTVRQIGYTNSSMGFDADTCAVLTSVGKQSPDIAQGVDLDCDIGAGDQGLMFGYATNETDSLMPAPIHYAHELMIRHKALRTTSRLTHGDSVFLPDAKSQVTFNYAHGAPTTINTIVLSTQHIENISQQHLHDLVMAHIIGPSIPKDLITDETRILINPTGRFVIGGPMGDAGLTGRKIIVDTYGGMARHGGGAFSGKDPTKVDRSAAYAARFVAKNIVANNLADRCEIQLAYAIGVAKPVSVSIETFGTNKVPHSDIEHAVSRNFDLRPGAIIERLGLRRPIYQPTATFGHFGRSNFPWEQTIKLES